MSRKITYEEVFNAFKNAGCTLLDAEYVSAKTKMKYICQCGNISYITYDSFKNGTRCMDCGREAMKQKQKYSYDYIFNYFKEHDCELLSKEYKNNKQKLKYRCECGNISYVTFSHFQEGQRCKFCKDNRIHEATKFTHEYVKQYFADRNCILLSDDYVNAQEHLLYQCSCGNIAQTTYRDFSRGSRCKECMGDKIADKLRLSYQAVYDDFKKYDYELLESSYQNAHQKLKYKCPEGHIHSMEYASFYSGARCPECSLKNRSGENHYLWNPNLTDEEREYGRLIPGYDEWRINVYKRDNYTCQICGYKGNELRAHHLNGYHWFVKGRTDVNNAITLCKKCHDISEINSFHYVYGNWYNTKEQFEEFLLFKNNQINSKQKTG